MVMLKSIKEIKNIGVFANFVNGASVRFEKINFIYGLNTYGKTTLADIFESLKSNDSSIIISRKTIPETSFGQKVTLSVKETEVDSEKELLFQNGQWGNNSISPYIEIFGTEFIHKNIFTGLTIERGNKENFTRFILGEQGVLLAEQIGKKKQELGSMKKDLKNKLPHFLHGKNDVEVKSFLALSIDGLIKDDLESEIYEKRISLSNEKERQKEPSKILSLKMPNKLEVPRNMILEVADSLNTLFAEDYLSIKEESVKKLEQHLSMNFSDKDGAENWIKTGLYYCKEQENMNCPFCGQKLRTVGDLIDLYNSYFDVAYNDFFERVSRELNDNVKIIQDVNFNQKSALQTAFSVINQYKDLIKSSRFQLELLSFEEGINSIQEDILNSKKNEFLSLIKVQLLEKIKSPYKKIEQIDFSSLKDSANKYYSVLIVLKEKNEMLMEEINIFRNQYKDLSAIEKTIAELAKAIAILERQKARIESDEACVNYKLLQKNILDFEEEIKKLNNKLQEEQSCYLEKFFDKIDRVFKKLGSKNFKLERETDRGGHLPVYSLKIKFHEKEIPSKQLSTVFSESDRRALALAVFLVKLSLKSDDERSKTIIILDDPVTSFDENRVTHTINLFKQYLTSVSQMFVLTHYPNLIRRFCEITKLNHMSAKFIQLDLGVITSSLVSLDIKQFNGSDYEKMFLKIYNYINRVDKSSIKTDLRPFLENLYLPIVFAKKIKDDNVDCGSLESMIDGIFDNKSIRLKFHQFRTDLNPDSHIITSNNEEDIRSYAEEMMNYLYSLKHEGDA